MAGKMSPRPVQIPEASSQISRLAADVRSS
jgi:hypothetical protein